MAGQWPGDILQRRALPGRQDDLHHIDEEGGEHFPDFARYLTDADVQFMRSVFEGRKRAECAEAEVTLEKLEDARE